MMSLKPQQGAFCGMSDFRKLDVWRKAHALSLNSHRGQETNKDQCRFLNYAINSMEYHLLSGRDLGIIATNDYVSLLEQVVEVRKMLYGLINYLRGQEEGE